MEKEVEIIKNKLTEFIKLKQKGKWGDVPPSGMLKSAYGKSRGNTFEELPLSKNFSTMIEKNEPVGASGKIERQKGVVEPMFTIKEEDKKN